MRLGYRPGYEPKPSATRGGQRVDTPAIDTSRTGEVRALVQSETQDDWHQQHIVNERVKGRLDANHENWQAIVRLDLVEALQQLAAMKRDLIWHWVIIAGLAIAVFELYRK